MNYEKIHEGRNKLIAEAQQITAQQWDDAPEKDKYFDDFAGVLCPALRLKDGTKTPHAWPHNWRYVRIAAKISFAFYL